MAPAQNRRRRPPPVRAARADRPRGSPIQPIGALARFVALRAQIGVHGFRARGGVYPRAARSANPGAAPRNDITLGGPLAQGMAQAAVPPTVSPSMRKVGWPTPTGTP